MTTADTPVAAAVAAQDLIEDLERRLQQARADRALAIWRAHQAGMSTYAIAAAIGAGPDGHDRVSASTAQNAITLHRQLAEGAHRPT